ncbi:DUF1214 domain-containing protein [soil metagenome]
MHHPPIEGHAVWTDDQSQMLDEAADLIVSLGPDLLATTVAQIADSLPNQALDQVTAYARELILCTALQHLNSDPVRPRVMRNLFPGARAGLDNPDTIYRFIPVSADSSYVIRGRRGSSTDVSFQLFDAWQGDGVLGEQLGFLSGEFLQVDDAGTFELTLDATPADGRANHVQLPPDSFQLTVRDTLVDWRLQPMHLSVERLDGADSPAPRPTLSLAERIRRQARFWPPIVGAFCGIAPNSVGAPNPTQGGLASQYSAPGHYLLDDEDALVIEFGAGGAQYAGIQLGTRQFISIDYWDRLTSLNLSQLHPEPDGRFRVVISRRDPGVLNWLDPGPHAEGIIFMRWQAMTGPLASADHPTALVRPVGQVGSMAGADAGCDQARRRDQLEVRAAALASRADTAPTS